MTEALNGTGARWMIFVLGILQTIVLLFNGWLGVNLVGTLQTTSTNKVEIAALAREVDRSFRIADLLDSKLDAISDDRFRGSDGRELEARIRADLVKLSLEIAKQESRIRELEKQESRIRELEKMK